jgi:hypothetical protein
MFGLTKTRPHSPRTGRLGKEDGGNLVDAVITLSDKLVSARNDEQITEADAPFVQACQRQTDNLKPRETRFLTIYRRAFS